jgi:hypothetical protein
MTILRICNEPGCGHLIKPGEGRCPEHKAARARRKRADPRHRARMTIYSSRRWREQTRPAVLARAGGRCERCGEAGQLDVCHLVPTTQLVGTEAAFDVELCLALCRSCHNAYGAPHRWRTGPPERG